MTDSQMPSESASSSRSDATAVMPQVVSGEQPPGTPQGMRPKKGMPGWGWALIGALAVMLLLGAFAVGRGVRMRQAATESTATAGVEITSTSGTSDLVTSGESGSEVVVTDESAGSGSDDSAASGDAASSDDADAEEDGSAPSDSAADSGSDDSAASEEPIGDAGGEEMVPSEYRSVLKVTGTREYVSAPIRLEPGRMELTIHVTRTTHDPMVARVARGGGGPITWWSTTNAVNGATRTMEMNVPGTAEYRFLIDCPPGSGWSLRVRWKR